MAKKTQFVNPLYRKYPIFTFSGGWAQIAEYQFDQSAD